MFTIQDVALQYDGLKVLDKFSLKAEENQFISLFGPSGVGKTTILNILARILKPKEGYVSTDKERLAYVFQEPRLLPWMTVEQNIEVGLFTFKKDEKWRKQIVQQLMPRIGLEEFSNYYPEQLSGGMRQRVSIGRAFAIQPDLILLDEPFSGLDENLKVEMQDLILSLENWHLCTTVMVTHDMREAIKLSDRIIVLDQRPCRIILDVIVKKEGKGDVDYQRRLEERIVLAKNKIRRNGENDEKKNFSSYALHSIGL